MTMLRDLSFRWLVCVWLTLGYNLSQASEVDSFTQRHILRDSAPFLNQVVNVWMEEAVIDANSPPLLSQITDEKPPACDEARLMDALKSRLAAYLIGQLETFANKSTALDSIHTRFADSIYRDFDFTESPTFALTQRLAVLLRVGNVYLGADKFGHFFTEGYAYYERYATDGEQSALQYGELTEGTFYGELATGIFSFADLTANLNGLRFWNSVLALKPDPVTQRMTEKPYIGCRNGQWQRLRAFDWRDYVDPAWDEAINCNAYRDKSLLRKAGKRIAQTGAGHQCPLVYYDIRPLQYKYGRLLPAILNRQGARVLKSFNHQLQQYWDDIVKKLDIALQPMSATS